MLDWRRELGSVCHGYVCIHLYIKPIWCSHFAEIYAGLEEGVQSVCHGYRFILLYVNLISCSGFPVTYAKLERGWGQSAIGICAFLYK